MPQYRRSARSTALNTVAVGPVTMARAMLTTAVARARSTIQTAQRISAMVQSVELLDDRMDVSATPEVLGAGPTVCLPLGKENVALQGNVSVEKNAHSVVITLKLNAYLLDRAKTSHFGPLVSRMTGRFNTQVRINLRETIDIASAVEPTPVSRRLSTTHRR